MSEPANHAELPSIDVRFDLGDEEKPDLRWVRFDYKVGGSIENTLMFLSGSIDCEHWLRCELF